MLPHIGPMSDHRTSLIPKTESSSSPAKSAAGNTFRNVGSLIRLLPTGTVFAFQFLNPVVTNSGECSAANKTMASVLITLCGFSCAFSCFTDSYRSSDGKRCYGIVTKRGLWTSSDQEFMELSKYELCIGDFVHAFFGLFVFAVVALLDVNTANCLYPEFEKTQRDLVTMLPPVIGVFSSVVFSLFPSKRHGIGYPPPDD